MCWKNVPYEKWANFAKFMLEYNSEMGCGGPEFLSAGFKIFATSSSTYGG
jgi:hypothetical protein